MKNRLLELLQKTQIRSVYVFCNRIYDNPSALRTATSTSIEDMNSKFVKLNDEQVAFYDAHKTATVMEVWNCELSVERAKQKKIEEIIAYDKSNAVDVFFVDNIPMWLDKSDRGGLVTLVEAIRREGGTTIEIWSKDEIPFKVDMPLDKALDILAPLEVYASKCFNIKARNINAVYLLDTIAEIEDFDYTIGYPEYCRFTLTTEM